MLCLNRLAIMAFEEHLSQRRTFEEQMRQMAADPAIQEECARIDEEFRQTEMDGLNS